MPQPAWLRLRHALCWSHRRSRFDSMGFCAKPHDCLKIISSLFPGEEVSMWFLLALIFI